MRALHPFLSRPIGPIAAWLALALAVWAAATTDARADQRLYPPGERASALLEVERLVPSPTDDALVYRIRIRNLTAEDGGNGREQVVEGIVLEEPLPPGALLAVEQVRTDLGTTRVSTTELGPCKALRLDELFGFPQGDESLTPNMRATLVRWLAGLPEGRITLIGYADPSGAPQINRVLSRARADKVRDYLAGKGRRRDRIATLGRGAEDLVTTDPAGIALNRRVGLYPGEYPRLHWTLPQLRPGQVAELAVHLSPGAFLHDRPLASLLETGPCYDATLTHRGLGATLPDLRIAASVTQQTPADTGTDPAALSQCDPFELALTLANHGERSALDWQLAVDLPAGLTPEGPEPAWQGEQLARGAEVQRTLRIAPTIGHADPGTSRDAELIIRAAASPGPATLRQGLALKLRRPQIELTLGGLPDPLLAGQWADLRIGITNTGAWPLHQLRLAAVLPAGLALELDPAGNPTWDLGELPPGASTSRALRLRVMENRQGVPVELVLQAHDAAYGDHADNRCVTGERGFSTAIGSLAGPELTIGRSEEVVAVGAGLELTARLTNRDRVTQTFVLGGRLARGLWEVPPEGLALSAGDDRPAARLRFTDAESDAFELITDDGQPFALTLGPGEHADLTLALVVRGLDERALEALSGSMVSRFQVAELVLWARDRNGLVEGEGRAGVLIYR